LDLIHEWFRWLGWVNSFDTMWLFIINGGNRSFIRLSFANKQLMENDRCPTQDLL
jgi:hypothetical protein